jgi:MFS family permease
MNGELHRGRLFLGCIIALVATAFGFIVRADLIGVWGEEFKLSEEQKGVILGAGLYPFAISIILFSLIVDKIGYGVSMVFAFFGHVIGALVAIYAGFVGKDNPQAAFQLLYLGAFITALANGIVEAVINPVTATMYRENKTHYLNILHAGWPGGLVLGGLLAISFGLLPEATLSNMPLGLKDWQWKVALVLLPTLAYGVLLMGQKFPVQERVAAGVTFRDMMREFGAGSCFIVVFLLTWGIIQILDVTGAGILQEEGFLYEPRNKLAVAAIVGGISAVAFFVAYGAVGRPMFILLLLVMLLLATTELGTDGWITDIMKGVFKDKDSKFNPAALVLIYTSFIMFVLRFFAGPIVHRISPLGLLAASAAIACGGLLFIANAGSAPFMIFLAATLYGFGKTFFWPTTLGVVSEQFPKGGALMLNAIAGVGMIGVGVLGGPLMGTVQDRDIVATLEKKDPLVSAAVVEEKPGILGKSLSVDPKKLEALPATKKEEAEKTISSTRQQFLAKVAILPGIMLVCYLLLIGYFWTKGGYKAKALHGEEEAPSEY